MWSFNKSEDVNLLCQKGVYPYSHIKNFEVFKETCLPPKEAFRNDPTGGDISSEKYEFAQRVWSSMGCNTLGDYHDLYLYQDILLLADIFEQSCMPQELSARPCALLYGTRIGQVKLETLQDIEMH